MVRLDSEAYFLPLRMAFEANANDFAAIQMCNYLKGKFPFYGLASPLRRQLQQKFYSEYGYPTAAMLSDIIQYTWRAEQREWQYTGMELALRFLRKSDEDLLQLAEFMITHKSWWDTVDLVAAKIAGAIFRKHPALIKPYTTRWISSGNLWLMRSALLFQLKYKKDTNQELLFSYILKCASSKEFFLRKAIGWTLREYSKTAPDIVRLFVESHELSPLSRKEALRIILKETNDQIE
jgi:3-methyladenine DNA glycosylase AlkD